MWFVCVCLCDFFFFSYFFVKFTCVATRMIFVVCGGLCVRYLGRMVDALAC